MNQLIDVIREMDRALPPAPWEGVGVGEGPEDTLQDANGNNFAYDMWEGVPERIARLRNALPGIIQILETARAAMTTATPGYKTRDPFFGYVIHNGIPILLRFRESLTLSRSIWGTPEDLSFCVRFRPEEIFDTPEEALDAYHKREQHPTDISDTPEGDT